MTAQPVQQEEAVEVTPDQLRTMPFEDLVALLDREGIVVPDTVDASNQEAIVDWVVSEFGA